MFLLLVGSLYATATIGISVWPLPSQYSSGTQPLWIAENVQFTYETINNTTKNITYGSQTTNESQPASALSTKLVVDAAIARTKYRLFNDKFIPWKFHPRNSNFEPPTNALKSYIREIALVQNASDPTNVFKALDGELDESYNMAITQDGQITITSLTSLGILHALETLTQLFYQSSSGGIYIPNAPVSITDAPRFPHRGLNLDVSRAYYAPSDIMRTIDALAWNKFNRLHLHASDSQSWPLEIPALPELAKDGAYMNGLSYSPAVLAGIQEYGAYRGIQVSIETDMPGHTSSIALAYPDLIAAFNVQPDWATYSAEPPSGQLKLNSSAVYEFLGTLWSDLLPRVSPYTAYHHTGGDEVNANVYLLDEGVRSNESSVIQPLLQKFIDFNHEHVRAAALTPMVWEEQLLQWNLTLGSDVVVQTWMSDDSLARTVAMGHKALFGNYNYWYLDCGKGQFLDFYPASFQEYYPFTDYCSPTKNWRLIYSYDPLYNIPPNSTYLVLGGEIHMWSEQTDPVILDSMIWPRACAAGEVLWSGAKDAQGMNRSQVEASPRLGEMRERMVLRGVGAGPVQMVYCTQNGTQCAL